MIHVRKSWFALAHQDPAFLFASLSHYAGGCSLTRRPGDPTDSLRLRLKSIHLLNERMASTKEALRGSTIGAVASIITYEVLSQNLGQGLVRILPDICHFIGKQWVDISHQSPHGRLEKDGLATRRPTWSGDLWGPVPTHRLVRALLRPQAYESNP